MNTEGRITARIISYTRISFYYCAGNISTIDLRKQEATRISFFSLKQEGKEKQTMADTQLYNMMLNKWLDENNDVNTNTSLPCIWGNQTSNVWGNQTSNVWGNQTSSVWGNQTSSVWGQAKTGM